MPQSKSVAYEQLLTAQHELYLAWRAAEMIEEFERVKALEADPTRVIPLDKESLRQRIEEILKRDPRV